MNEYVDPTKDQFGRFRDLPSHGPVHMLNLVRVREQVVYPDGRKCSGREAYEVYARESAPIFTRVGGRQFWVGEFELMLIGPADERWDFVFIAEYPNAAAFVEMVRDPAYREAVKHRQAAVLDSRLIRLKPKAPGNAFGH